jgi:hypothetical protein
MAQPLKKVEMKLEGEGTSLVRVYVPKVKEFSRPNELLNLIVTDECRAGRSMAKLVPPKESAPPSIGSFEFTKKWKKSPALKQVFQADASGLWKGANKDTHSLYTFNKFQELAKKNGNLLGRVFRPKTDTVEKLFSAFETHVSPNCSL